VSLPSIVVSAYSATTAANRGRAALLDALRARRGALRACDWSPFGASGPRHRIDTWIGEVAGADDVRLPAPLAQYDCRNNRLALLALQHDGLLDAAARLRATYGAARVAVILGTSTSGLLQAEWAYQRRVPPGAGPLPADFDYAGTLNCYSASAFVAALTGLAGPSFIISTACSSSAKVFAAAARLMEAGVVDAALVGGVDSLCLTTLYGFGSLELLDRAPCRPYSADRSGISIGEGAGFAVLEHERRAAHAHVRLAGWGESSDAFHMSTPHPDGLGAQLAMRRALARAGVAADAVGYVNLHGTATRTNDQAEGNAVAAVLGADVPTSSTKAWFGHLLGAAGIAEAAVTMLAIEHDLLPGTLNTAAKDAACPNRLLIDNEPARVAFALTNSFGFGGSNCSLLFARI
jgi:3-oxoacyl-[acyl-carrier-protein] synthase-1